MSEEMTPRQADIYDFIKDKILTRGFGPTVREIGDHFGIKSPNGVMCHLRALQRKNLITRTEKMSRSIQLVEGLSRHALPLAGRIAAGRPLEAFEYEEDIDFGPLFDVAKDQFCLQVTGDSMIDAQIAEGDYVVVRSQKTCKDGEIVVALVDGSDATLKRFYRDQGRIRLEPANSTMKPIFATNVQIVGVVVGVIRRYG